MLVGALAGTLVACGGSDTPSNPMGTAGISGTTAGTGAGGGAGAAGSTAGGGAGAAGTMVVGGSGGAGGASGTGTAGTMASMCMGTETECNVCKDKAEGIYAMKVELDVWWRDEVNTTGELADAGRGKLYIYFRGEIKDVSDDGKDGKGLMHPCGTELPTLYASANCTAIVIQFPDTIWDKASVPTYETKGSTTGFGVGDTLTVAKTLGFLGIATMPGAAFPKPDETTTFACPAGTGEDCFPDQDEDGKPGITVTFRKDEVTVDGPYLPEVCNGLTPKYKYFGAPLSLLGALDAASYADEAQIGLSTELGGSGVIEEGCASGVGVAEAGMGLPSRVIHCEKKNNMVCTATEETFLDANTPNYHILQKGEMPPMEFKNPNAAKNMKLDRSASLGPRSSVIRLGDPGFAAACADIRATTFLPFK